MQAGDVYGYLGPNGAGKTTSLRMMLGLIVPTEGSVRLFGRDPQAGVAALEGVAGFVEAPRFYPYLTGRRNLELLAAFDGGDAAERLPEALETVELTDRAKDKVGGYSHGMRQRLGIAAALLRNPKLLLLDEPATGLDPAGMRDMRAPDPPARRRGHDGRCSRATCWPRSRSSATASRSSARGRIVYEGHISELKRTAASAYRLRTTDDARALEVCRAQRGIADAARGGGRRSTSPPTRPPCRAVGRAGRGGRADPRAGAPDRDARGPVLLAHRGRREAGRRRAPARRSSRTRHEAQRR